MVDGHDTERKLAAVDLDGTYVGGNTLRIYFGCAVADALSRADVKTAAALGALAALRAARMISHRRFKFAFLARVAVTEGLRSRFVKKALSQVRPEVEALVAAMRRDGTEVVLATAAPDFYIPWIWQGPYIATPVKGNPGRMEMRGTAKSAAVAAYAASRGLALDTVVTDHSDDLPLLRSGARRNILVRPSSHTLMTVRLAGVEPLEIM